MQPRIKLALMASAIIVFSTSPALSQSSSAPLVVGQPAAQTNVLRAGTEITMRTRTELSSRSSRVGERFELETTDPVTLSGQVVIPAGSIAVGEVTRVRHKGMWGRRGILETRLVHVRVGDRQIRISGAAGDRGRAGTAGVVASVVLLPVVGFFVTGTSAIVPPGTTTVAYTDEDVPVVFAGGVAPQPLVIQAASPEPAPIVASPPAAVVPVAATATTASAFTPYAPSAAGGGSEWVQRDCNVGGSGCRVVARHRSQAQCERARTRMVSQVRGREGSCTFE